MFRHRSATPAGVTGNGEVRSLGDNLTSIFGSVVDARADTATASITAVGGQQSGRGQLSGVGGVELDAGLEIADRGLQHGDPILEGFPGVQDGGLGVGGHGAPEWLRDRKLLSHMQ